MSFANLHDDLVQLQLTEKYRKIPQVIHSPKKPTKMCVIGWPISTVLIISFPDYVSKLEIASVIAENSDNSLDS